MKRATRLALVFLLSGTCALPLVRGEDVERVERGNLVIEGIPEIPAELTDRLDRYQNSRTAILQGWLPGGRGMLISTRFGETSQMHHVEQPGGARRQITFYPEPVSNAVVSPSAEVNGFIFQKDVGGSEFFQLFFQDLATGHTQMLSDGKSRYGGVTFAPDGKKYAYFTTARNGKDWDVHLATLGSGDPARPVLEREGTWYPVEFSPDGRRLLVGRYIAASESYIHLIDLASGEITQVNPVEEKIAYGDTEWAADGRGLFFASDQGSEFKRLQYIDLQTGRIDVLTADIPWDVNAVEVDPRGRWVAFTVNEDGIARLHVRNLKTGRDLKLPDLPVGQAFGLEVDPGGGRLGIVLNTPRTPGDTFSIDVESGRLTRWTHSEIGGLNSERFTVPELVRYETFDTVEGSGGKKRTIPAFFYKPKGKGPFPVLVQIHGGPEGQSRPTFNPSLQFYIDELGVAVLVPNVRGSTGYGKSFREMDNGFKREDSVKDIGALLDWIETRPELDQDRVAVAGGSYGGYMVLASMIHFADRLRAGVDVVGISNFVTFLKNTQDYRRDLRRAEYGDERDPEMREFLEKISPTRQAASIKKPLFIAQGLNDPRVPASESEQMVREIRKAGGQVWYLMATDEGHGFRKKGNRDYYRSAVALFLEQFLLPEGEGGAVARGGGR